MTNQELIKTWYHQMWNKWDKTVFPDILHENITFRGSLGQEKKGFAGLSDYIDFIQAAFPDFHNQIDLIINEEDKAFAKLTYSGTHKGITFGIPPTGKKMAYAGAAVFTFKEEKILDVWVLGDIYGLLGQLR